MIKNNKRKINQPLTKTQVRQMIQGTIRSDAETKSFTNVLASFSATVAGTIIAISQPIVAGGFANQRDAAQITTEELWLRVGAFIPPAGDSQQLRLILFQDKQANGAVPAITDILDTASWNSCYNVTTQIQQQRFHLIDDTTVCLNIGGDRNIFIEKRFKKMLHKITYFGTTNVAAVNGANSLFLAVLTDFAVTPPVVSASWNITYYDM